MSNDTDKMFRIKHRDREYLVLTTKMHNEIMNAMTQEEFARASQFLKDSGKATTVVNDPLFEVLLKLYMYYEEKREEFTIG